MVSFTVLVTDHDFEDLAVERSVLGSEVDIVEATGSLPDESPVPLADVDGVLNLREPIDSETIERLSNCRIIARYGIGVDNVNVPAATEHGIPVTNVPDYCVEEVATHTLSMILAVARGLVPYTRSVSEGKWDRNIAARLHRFSNQTIGIVGYGKIGRAVGQLIAAFDAGVLAMDPVLSSGDLVGDPAERTDFETLLDRSDFVTVHAPLTEATTGLFDAGAFARMKPSSILINVARGPIVDESALLTSLEEGEIAGAALDVFTDEPPDEDNPLRAHPKVLTTPHVAWYSEEANVDRRREAAREVRAVLHGDRPANPVNDGDGLT